MASPFCQAQVSVNGGAYVSGLVSPVPFGATVAFRNAVSSATGLRWELFDYPPDLALGTGWQNINGVYTYMGPTPTPLVMPASSETAWGMIPVSLNVNNNPLQYLDDGSLNPSYNALYQDLSTLLVLPSPNLNMPGICAQLSTQYDALRSWPAALMACLRLIDAGGGGGSTPWLQQQTVNAAGTVVALVGRMVYVDASGGTCNVTAPAPVAGKYFGITDWAQGTPPAPTFSNAHGADIANPGNNIEDPNYPGTFTTPTIHQRTPGETAIWQCDPSGTYWKWID